MASLSPTVIHLIVTFCVIVAICIVVLLYAVTRPQRQPDYAQDLQIYEEQMASRRNDFTFTFNQHSGGYNLKRWNGGSNMPTSDSMVTIQISPSQPTIFGDEKNKESTMKVMLTPPTPAKRERRAVLNNA